MLLLSKEESDRYESNQRERKPTTGVVGKSGMEHTQLKQSRRHVGREECQPMSSKVKVEDLRCDKTPGVPVDKGLEDDKDRSN